MPTPFMHLLAAERMMGSTALRPSVRAPLAANYPAFLFGNVAPDFQILCDVPRQATHFYGLPPHPDEDPVRNMFASYPALSRPDGIHEAEVAFIAGYCAHLALDLIWHREVLQPVFLLADSWASNRQRYLVHNTLLTYLDREAVASLRGDAAVALASAEPIGWLPFARDRELRAWRDFIAGQLAPGGSVRTVGVFAGRMRMSEEEFAANLSDPDWMADYLFGSVPIAAVQRALDDAVTSGARLVTAYLEGRKSS